ncbi:MAG: type II toxin-antitoxin system RelE/ParE family toxin [Patescibacteria group bacterium]
MNSSASWILRIDPAVFKVLKKIPRSDTQAILKVIKLLPINPYFGDIQKMKGEANTWRRRIGVYRIFFKLITDSRIILVFHLERRTSTTY